MFNKITTQRRLASRKSAMCAEAARYFSAGVNDVLAKPFSLSQLAAVLNRWCVLLEEPAQTVC